jgi:hypothetical protein
MDVSDLKKWIVRLLCEEINRDQLASVSKSLGIDENTLKEWVNRVDPTPNKGYSVWILRGLKRKDFLLEDERRISLAIAEHIRLRFARLVPDIMQFPTLNQLETAIAPLSMVGAKRQGYAGVDPTTLPGVEILEQRPDITFFKVYNASSLAKMGEGTKWCTRYSFLKNINTADAYIKRHGYVVVGYKDGKPFVQYNADFSMVQDVNDVGFHGQTAKSLNLPRPTYLKTPKLTKRTISNRGGGPSDIFRKWMQYTLNPGAISQELPKGMLERDLKFEKVLTNSIKNSNNFVYLLEVCRALMEYIPSLHGQRLPELEKVIVEKNWDEAWKYRNSHHGKHSRIPIIEAIISYVTNVIGTNWPEFEKTIEDDPYNASIYFSRTDLDPIYIQNPITRDLILFSKFIKDKHPSISDPEFELALRNFYVEGRKKYKHSKFTQILDKVLIPYIEYSKKSVTELLGPEEARKLYKNTSFLRRVVQQDQHRDPVLERLLLKKLKNSLQVDALGYDWGLIPRVIDYCKNVLQGPWPEAEKIMLNPLNEIIFRQGLGDIARYNHQIKQNNWPELESVIKRYDLQSSWELIQRRGY